MVESGRSIPVQVSSKSEGGRRDCRVVSGSLGGQKLGHSFHVFFWLSPLWSPNIIGLTGTSEG